MKYKPMLAEPLETPFNNPNWLFEVKWDGVRAIAYVGNTLSILSRNDNEISQNFPELNELKKLTKNVVLDGEIIVMQSGRPDFPAVAKRVLASKPVDIELRVKDTPCTYIVFDILEKDGQQLTEKPLSERKTILRESMKDGDHVIVSSYVKEDGTNYFEAVKLKGLEGIVAKMLNSPYRLEARSKEWLKIKTVKTVDCLVIGFTQGTGNRENSFGALLLGIYDNGKLTYIGRVGTGFTDKALEELLSTFKPFETPERQVEASDIPKDSRWLKPKLVAEVAYQNLTEDFRLRAPRFLRLRNDKTPQTCTIDQVRPSTLDEYKTKRNFSKSPEPIGGASKSSGSSFVIQEHHASRLHWDLRLEKDGVLKSWAVPKQPPETPGEKRLAVQVEDHPLDYGGFEGVIPAGEYGAGTVKIWDHGTYDLLKWTDDKVEFIIKGERLNGHYELIRFKKAGEKEWLLFKKKEE